MALANNAQYIAEWFSKLSKAYADGSSPGTPPPFTVDPMDYSDGQVPGNAKYWSALSETTLAAKAAQASASAASAATSAANSAGHASASLASQEAAALAETAASASSVTAVAARIDAEAASATAAASAAQADTDADRAAVSQAASEVSATDSQVAAAASEAYMLSAEADNWAAEAARQEAEYWAQQAANSAASAIGYDPSDELTWIDYASNWAEEPTLIGTTSEGDVYSYTYTTSTLYRLVPSSTSTLKDSFYANWDGSVLSNLTTSRTLNI